MPERSVVWPAVGHQHTVSADLRPGTPYGCLVGSGTPPCCLVGSACCKIPAEQLEKCHKALKQMIADQQQAQQEQRLQMEMLQRRLDILQQEVQMLHRQMLVYSPYPHYPYYPNYQYGYGPYYQYGQYGPPEGPPPLPTYISQPMPVPPIAYPITTTTPCVPPQQPQQPLPPPPCGIRPSMPSEYAPIPTPPRCTPAPQTLPVMPPVPASESQSALGCPTTVTSATAPACTVPWETSDALPQEAPGTKHATFEFQVVPNLLPPSRRMGTMGGMGSGYNGGLMGMSGPGSR